MHSSPCQHHPALQRTWRLSGAEASRELHPGGRIPPASPAAGLRSAHCAALPAALEASAPGASSAQRRFASSHAHAPADELASGTLPEAAAAAEPVELLEETLQDEEQEEGASELDATILPPLPSGPGSEFVRSDPLGSLQLGERLETSAKFHGRPWLFETGRMARLADGSCTLRVGDTTLLATAVCSTQSGGRRDPLAPQLEVRRGRAASRQGGLG